MELKDFVSETIIQISQGIAEAQERTRDSGTIINPPTKGSIENLRTLFGNIEHTVQSIDFDICLTVENSSSKEKGGKIGVLTAIIGGDISRSSETSDTSQAINRIKFSIPVIFPLGKIQNLDQTSPYSRL